ncbi:MAG: hypothetical protein MZV63_65645 [Marinilabiliales bacterium]|nr:hypothetical protein [Marinilabiliales bacterium]
MRTQPRFTASRPNSRPMSGMATLVAEAMKGVRNEETMGMARPSGGGRDRRRVRRVRSFRGVHYTDRAGPGLRHLRGHVPRARVPVAETRSRFFLAAEGSGGGSRGFRRGRGGVTRRRR